MTVSIYWLVNEAGPVMAKWLVGEEIDFLSPAERDRLAGLRFERRRSEWLLGRWTAKQVIRCGSNLLAGVPLDQLSIQNAPGGVPQVFFGLGGERLNGTVSISHRDHMAACAWTGDTESGLGIDIDLVEKRDPSFLSDYFTPTEQAFARALPGDVQDLWITLAWSAKEAVLKVLGVGLRLDTRRVEIRSVRGLFNAGEAKNDWNVLDVRCAERSYGRWNGWWRIHGAYVITLAAWSPSGDVQLRAC